MSKPKSSKASGGCCSWPCCCRAFLVICILLGLILAVIGVFGVLRHRAFFIKMVSKKMPLTPTSSTFASFEKPPADIFMAFYFFNVTNPQSVINGSKPIVREIGPYVYKNPREKYNISFSDDTTEVFFDERRFYVFDESRSVGSDNDKFISVDLVGYKIAKTAYDEGKIKYVAKTFTVTGRVSPFKEHVVKDFLFGANDRLMEKILPLKFKDPATRPAPIFGILINKDTGESKNGTWAGNYTLYTGTDDMAKYRNVVKYNGKSRYPDIWPVENITNPITGEPLDSNIIRGTLGSGFPPNVNEDRILTAFSADLCLSIDFAYNAPSKRGPIDTMRFLIDVANWRTTVGDVNRAMCPPEGRNDPKQCMQNGIINATTCKKAALMMSLPHLLHADEFYRTTVDGLTPDAEKHNIFLDVDPLTGAPLFVTKRLQINVRLLPFNYKDYTKLPEYTLMPIMWIEESGGVNPEGLVKLNAKVHNKCNMLKNISYVVLIVGIALLPVAIITYLIFKQRYNASRHDDYDLQVRQVQSGGPPMGYVPAKRMGDGSSDEKYPLHM